MMRDVPAMTSGRWMPRNGRVPKYLKALRAGVVRVTLVALTGCAVAPPPTTSATAPPRPITFETWRFRWDLHHEGFRDAWYGRQTDDTDWGPVKVPAYWSNTWIGDHQGFGWYRTHFEVPAHARHHDLALTFGAVDEQAWVFLDGRMIGEHSVASENAPFSALWNRPFTLHVPARQLRPGERHLLTVLVHSAVGDGGIWLPISATLQPARTP